MAIACTPEERLEKFKCLECGSESQLLLVLLLALAKNRHAGYTMPDDTNQLMQDSACWACLSDKQLLQAVVSTVSEWVEDEDWQPLVEEARCIQCANPKQIKAAIAFLICKIISGIASE